MSQIPHPNGSLRARCNGHKCHRSVQELAHMFFNVPLMGSCSQFCIIQHPHRVPVPFPPTFALPWQNNFVEIHGEQFCSRQNLGAPHKNKPKTTKIGGWGHLMVQINPPGSHRLPMKVQSVNHDSTSGTICWIVSILMVLKIQQTRFYFHYWFK